MGGTARRHVGEATMTPAFWRMIDRVCAAIMAGDLDTARRHLAVAVRVHRGPYEEQSIRHWQDRIDRAEEAMERKTA